MHKGGAALSAQQTGMHAPDQLIQHALKMYSTALGQQQACGSRLTLLHQPSRAVWVVPELDICLHFARPEKRHPAAVARSLEGEELGVRSAE